VGNSLELIKLGKERGIKGLGDLHDDLVTLEVLVYEVGVSHMVTIMLMHHCFNYVTDLIKLVIK